MGINKMIREKIILYYARNKDVLDIGSTGQTSEYDLFGEIKGVAHSITGIDTEILNELVHPNIFEGNMENYDFGRQFDVIVAGDIIEHVHNQGLFLDNIYKHLKDRGVLIITTPNAKWFTVMARPNLTHTAWHDRYTLEYILKKHDFRIMQFRYYYGNKPKYNFFQKLLVWRQGIIVTCTK